MLGFFGIGPMELLILGVIACLGVGIFVVVPVVVLLLTRKDASRKPPTHTSEDFAKNMPSASDAADSSENTPQG